MVHLHICLLWFTLPLVYYCTSYHRSIMVHRTIGLLWYTLPLKFYGTPCHWSTSKTSSEIESKCSLDGNFPLKFYESDFKKFDQNLHFKREGKIGFLPRIEMVLDMTEARLEILLELLLKDRVKVRSDLASENFQLSTYGIGGDVKPHFDTYGKPDEAYELFVDFGEEDTWWHGDRMISGLIYLSEPGLKGGATVFPHIDVIVAGEMGGIALWLNLDPSNLNPLKIMEHGSCPVITGQKWISNKWIRSYDQMFKFPCRV